MKRIAAALVWFVLSCLVSGQPMAGTDKPNILFIVLDDVGVDQFSSFGYGGVDAPRLPVMDAIAQGGLRFRNAWAMPTCSTTRATYFEGRYPFRTDVYNAILSTDLANSQVSPFEALTPKLLRKAGYKSALIGKMHLSGTNLAPKNNPFGNGVMKQLGWDYFAGWLDGAPYPIDTTAGGVGSEGDYSCGFVPASEATKGACWLSNGNCSLKDAPSGRPGFDCLSEGGIFVPDGRTGGDCTGSPSLNFSTQNAYYTGQLIVNDEEGQVTQYPISDPIARKYRSVLEADLAVDWIKQQEPSQPWMLSLGFSAAHAPLQQAPSDLYPAGGPGAPDPDGFDCSLVSDQRIMSNQILEAMDHEIGRLLIEAGIADADGDGVRMKAGSNTYVIITGDNGTYGPFVKVPPFNPQRAKGTVYQGGVWVPLIIAGPGIVSPGRKVEAMTNSADLYALFAEIAKVSIQNNVPRSRIVDAQSMIRYLRNPQQSGRRTNFSMMGENIRQPGVTIYPCVLEKLSICTQIFPQQQLCEDEGGTWYGPGGAAGASGLTSCCQVNAQRAADEQYDILPSEQKTIRNDAYKLVELVTPDCEAEAAGQDGATQISEEFYKIDQAENMPELDNRDSQNLLDGMRPLTRDERRNYEALRGQIADLTASERDCDGDGNRDGRVDATDVENYHYFVELTQGQSSWYDFNHDGLTNTRDLQVILRHLGKRCR